MINSREDKIKREGGRHGRIAIEMERDKETERERERETKQGNPLLTSALTTDPPDLLRLGKSRHVSARELTTETPDIQ